MHLRLNPVETASRRHLEHYHQLQEENDRLKKRVKVLQEEGQAAEDVTMKVKHKLQEEGSDSTLNSESAFIKISEVGCNSHFLSVENKFE